MLYPYNEPLLKCVVQDMAQKYQREARVDHLLDEIKPHRQGRLSQYTREALHHLGHLLLALGKRLDLPEVPRTSLMEGR